MTHQQERRLLQMAVLLGAFVPVLAGGAGMIWGAGMLAQHVDISLDSHIRYLSGLLFAIGISFWSIIPRIETKTYPARLLTFLVVTGGLARLAAAIFVGMPSVPMILAIGMEIVVTPLLCLWQSRIARFNK
jgi:hypothetical protein